MKRFKLFIAATFLCVGVAGFSAFKAAKIAVTEYYYYNPNPTEGPKCVFVGEADLDCQSEPTDFDCIENGFRIYEAVHPSNPDLCIDPLYKPE